MTGNAISNTNQQVKSISNKQTENTAHDVSIETDTYSRITAELWKIGRKVDHVMRVSHQTADGNQQGDVGSATQKRFCKMNIGLHERSFDKDDRRVPVDQAWRR